MTKHTHPEIRFWSKVDVRGPDECWEWMAGRHRGYGVIRVNGKQIRSNRFALALKIGPLGEGIHALHACDNPPCCNPAHLFPGTQADNIADAVAMGRNVSIPPTGTYHFAQKLTEADVHEIRELLAAGVRQAKIGMYYGVDQTLISQISRRKIWAHI
jgi:hypothetical protein